MDLNIFSPKDLADAVITISQIREKFRGAKLENQAKKQAIELAAQKANQESQKALLEIEEKILELELKKLDIAVEIVTKLRKLEIDEEAKVRLIQRILPGLQNCIAVKTYTNVTSIQNGVGENIRTENR